MEPDHREWSLRGPARALLWWPPIAFLLLAAVPGAGPELIALSGVGLAAVGTLAWVVGRWLPRPAATPTDEQPERLPTVDEAEQQTTAAGHRAA